MQPKRFALFGGILMLVLGLLALIPSLNDMNNNLPLLQVETSYGAFLGIFAMNIFNKVALIVFGIAGIAAANAPTTSLPKSILFARVTFVVMGLAAVLGAIPQTNTLYGYWPLFGNTMWEHGVFALLGAYFGFALTTEAKRINDKNDPKKQPVNHRPIGV